MFNEDLRRLLPDGEQPLALAHFQQAFGEDRLERSPEELNRLFGLLPGRVREQVIRTLEGPPRDRPAWERAIDFALIGPDIDPGIGDRLLGGTAASGHVGSWAAQWVAVTRSRTMLKLLVTNRRLLVLEQMTRANDPFELVFAMPRAAVLEARREGKFLQRGRVVLDFADLSQLALMTGMFDTKPADGVINALRMGTPAGG